MLNPAQLYQLHSAVLTSNSTKLGEILWFLVKASDDIDELAYPKVPKDENGGVRLSEIEPTEFQRELSGDEIHWWVFKKEDSLQELKQRTEVARDAVQQLKESAAKLKLKYRVSSYDELLALLKEYVESHSAEIDTLYQYVKWLHQRNPLAPSILFTYRVWGSTRRSERLFGGLASNLEDENLEVIRRLTEIALGLYKGGSYRSYIWESAYREAQMELAEGYSDDEGWHGPSGPSARAVLARTAHESFNEFAILFEFIRNSLNNILVDIEKQRNQTLLMKSDSFWRKFITKALRSRKSEQKLWDFKSTLNMWHIKPDREKDKAEVEFAEHVASFANAGGGILIVGVSNNPVEIMGIGDQQEIENKLKYIRQVLEKRVNYISDIFYLHEVDIDDGKGNSKHCLVIVIAQARNVVEVKAEDDRYSYPIRVETGVDRVARDEIVTKKMHINSDNFDFIQDLEQLFKE